MYRCTECETDHPTFDKAAQCHPGVGGVVEATTSKSYKPTHGGYPGTVEDQAESKPTSWVCLTCGDRLTGWGNNPDPLTTLPGVDPDRRVCGDCNAMYVIPLRLGHGVSGTLYNTRGGIAGEFYTKEAE